MPLTNCLRFIVSIGLHAREMLRRERRDALEAELLALARMIVSPMEKMPGSNTPMMSPA